MIRNPYILSITVATVLGWASWFVVLNKMGPFVPGYLPLVLFYASLFIALTGTFALLVYYLREWLGNKAEGAYFNTALREGTLLSIMINTGLIFQRLRVLTWWDALLLLLIIILLEFYVLASND